MPISLRIALVAITLIYVGLILKSIRNKKINVSYSIFWVVTGVLLVIISVVPNLIDSVTNLLGFETPANMLFCITIFIAFYLIFNLTVIISKEHRKNVVLIQEVSSLKKRLERLEEKSHE